MTEQTESAMQKFRRVNPRIDYFPTEDAVAAIVARFAITITITITI